MNITHGASPSFLNGLLFIIDNFVLLASSSTHVYQSVRDIVRGVFLMRNLDGLQKLIIRYLSGKVWPYHHL